MSIQIKPLLTILTISVVALAVYGVTRPETAPLPLPTTSTTTGLIPVRTGATPMYPNASPQTTADSPQTANYTPQATATTVDQYYSVNL